MQRIGHEKAIFLKADTLVFFTRTFDHHDEQVRPVPLVLPENQRDEGLLAPFPDRLEDGCPFAVPPRCIANLADLAFAQQDAAED